MYLQDFCPRDDQASYKLSSLWLLLRVRTREQAVFLPRENEGVGKNKDDHNADYCKRQRDSHAPKRRVMNDASAVLCMLRALRGQVLRE